MVTGIETMASKSSTVISSLEVSICLTRAFSPLKGPFMISTISPSVMSETMGLGER